MGKIILGFASLSSTTLVVAGLLAGAVVSSAACTRGDSQPAVARFELTPERNAIFSNRPQTQTHTLLLVKLQQPPLLSSVKVVDGKKQVDPKLAAAVLAEQDELLKSLNALSTDIKVVYRYRMVMNGVAIVAPIEVIEKIRSLANVAYVESNGSFSRPVLEENIARAGESFTDHNSVKFIGGTDAHARGIRGQGMRIGIIDTGIDYTHAMFGGAGTEAAYKAIDPKAPNAAFPSAKVVGGTDLAGTDYDSNSGDFARRLPTPDANPLDEAGHGSHVAGTVAGHGDGVTTYDGVAPDAVLYAIKVFGKEGSTGDATVIAGLEYAANPSLDGQASDQLDVVNLSLGGGYGDAHMLYTEAIQNLSRAGTFVVASAGNSGDSSYIVGAPSVAEDAISVAASIDDMDHNYKFRAVRFTTPDDTEILVEAIEGSIAKKIEDAGDVTGALVPAGIADKDFPDDLKAKIKGNVALIDRGAVPFSDKLKRAADAGAVGVVVANNQPGEPIPMGGEGMVAIPAIMITKALGDQLKAELGKGSVTIAFKTDKKIEKRELIDSITSFSSKGPRSFDALIKPEIAAPGSQVVSVKMGSGAAAVEMSGTSMAAPHMTGVMALMKQAHPELSSLELKSLVMGTAKILQEKGVDDPVSRQGSGRVQIIRALDASVVSIPASISLGEVTIESRKSLARSLELRNITKDPLTLEVGFSGKAGLRMSGPAQLTLLPGVKTQLDLKFTIDATAQTSASIELDGLVKLSAGGAEVMHLPVLAVANKVSQVMVDSVVIESTSAADSEGAVVDLSLRNPGANPGDAYLFNLIGLDGRKEDSTHDQFRSRACDLAGAGYRVISRGGDSILQFAVKLYEPVTTWDQCEVSVLIDSDGDGVADQELVGAKQDHLKGLTAQTFASILLDAKTTREIQRQYEVSSVGAKKADPDFSKAVLGLSPMLSFEHSTIAIIEAPVSSLALRATGELSVKIATSYQEASAIQPDNFLPGGWTQLGVAPNGAGFVGMPEKVSVGALQTAPLALRLTKGAGTEPLWALFPSNKPVIGGISADSQSQTVMPVYDAH